jgi:predicted N-acyltransferase
MDIEILDSISGIDSAEWDRVAGHDVLYSHDWLSLIESCPAEPVQFLYLLVRDKGKVVAAAACQIRLEHESASLDKAFYGGAAEVARRTGFRVTPAIVAGSRFGFSPPFIFDQSLSAPQIEEAGQALIREIVKRAELLNASVMLRNTKPGTFVDSLSSEGFIATPDVPTTYIDIKWNGFDDFRRDLKKIHPATEKAIRNQSNRARRDAIKVERITDPEMVSADLFEVIDSHYKRLNGISLPFNDSFLREAVRYLGDRADLTVVRDGSTVLGVHFAMRAHGVSHALHVGTSGERARATDTYYLLLNHVMNRAIQSRDRRLYLGRLLYDVKIRRGCSIEDSFIWIRGRSKLQRAGLKCVVPLRSMRIKRMIRAIEPASQANAVVLNGH